MKKEIAFITFILFALLSCNVLIDQPPTQEIATIAVTAPPLTSAVVVSVSPSPAALASATVTPSLTPSATVTRSSTPTPNATPTPDPNLNVKDEVYNDQFTGKSGWLWTFKDDVAEFGAVNGELRAKAKLSKGGWRYSLRFDKKFTDVQARFTAKATQCTDADEYGFAFRGNESPKDQFNMYILKLNCAGSARVEMLQGTQSATVKTLIDWKANPAILKGKDAQNKVIIWMSKDQFHFFVNDKYIFSLQDATYPEGYFGFYINDRSAGSTAVTFTDFVVKTIVP